MKLQCNLETHECIPFFLCLTDYTTDGANILNSRFSGNEVESASCKLNSEACCEKSKNVQRFVPTTCGLHNKDGVGFSVTNGIDEAQFAEVSSSFFKYFKIF